MFTAVTVSPDWVAVAFQALETFWSPGKVNFRVQPLTAVLPVSSITTFAVKPPAHSEVVEYATVQVAPPDAEADGLAEALAEAEGDADAEADGEADADADGEAEAVVPVPLETT